MLLLHKIVLWMIEGTVSALLDASLDSEVFRTYVGSTNDMMNDEVQSVSST